MSGVHGGVSFDGRSLPAETLEAMARAVPHLGSETAELRRGQVVLGRSSFHPQPICQRGDLLLVADARLDGRRELAHFLEPETGGRPADELTDEELIAAAYRRWGDACVEHLAGDFVFALWDGSRRRLLCARDPLGVRFLHYAEVPGGFVFASEARQLTAVAGVGGDLDEVALGLYLLNDTAEPDRTAFRAVRRLLPGHRLIADRHKCWTERYWDLATAAAAEPRYRHEAEYVERFRELWWRAVGDRLGPANGVTGVSLSGGLDSSSVAVTARQQGAAVIGYTCSFATLSLCDERRYVRDLATHTGIEVRPVDAESRWPLRPSDDLPSADHPFPIWGTAPVIARRLAEAGGTVLLTGDGGDNLLQGTPLVYTRALLTGRFDAWPQLRAFGRTQNRSPLRMLGSELRGVVLPRRRPRPLPEWMNPGFARRTRLAERRRQLAQAGSVTERVRSGIRGLEGVHRALYNWRRVAALSGVDVRFPFLDRRLAAFVAAVPAELLLRDGLRKWLLRRALHEELPASIRQRPDKTGFGGYLDLGLRVREAARLRAMLAEPLLAELGWVDAARLRSAYERYLAGSEAVSAPDLFFPITLERWLRQTSHALEENLRVAA